MSRLLSIDEAATSLSLSPLTLNTYRCRGRGPSFVKAGAEVFYRERDIRAWLDRGRPKQKRKHNVRHRSPKSYEGNSNRTLWPWRSMEIGDSFIAPNKNISGSISFQHRNTSRRFATRRTDAGWTVTRIA